MAAEPAISESGPRRRAVRLTPLQVPKASAVLADDLRERILRGDFPEGTALPTERELVNQTRMSRATIREALRILEVQGLVRIKTGRAGGAYVSRPGQDSMADSVGLLIRARRIRIPALLETREAIEPFCAQLAAKHRTDEDLGRLEAANEAIAAAGTLAAFLPAHVACHVAVPAPAPHDLMTSFLSGGVPCPVCSPSTSRRRCSYGISVVEAPWPLISRQFCTTSKASLGPHHLHIAASAVCGSP